MPSANSVVAWLCYSFAILTAYVYLSLAGGSCLGLLGVGVDPMPPLFVGFALSSTFFGPVVLGGCCSQGCCEYVHALLRAHIVAPPPQHTFSKFMKW